MRYLNRLTTVIDGISEAVAAVIIYLVVVLTAVLGYEIVARYVFNSPTRWVFDISYMIGGTFFCSVWPMPSSTSGMCASTFFTAGFLNGCRRPWMHCSTWCFSFLCGSACWFTCTRM